MKKNRWCYLILIVSAISFAVQAQEIENTKFFVPKSLGQKGSKMRVELDFDMSQLRVGSNESKVYTPILVSGSRQLELPQMIIKGGRRYKADYREEQLSGQPVELSRVPEGQKAPEIYAVEKYRRNVHYPYLVSVPYSSWMDKATINLREETYECCGELKNTAVLKKTIAKEKKEPLVAEEYDIRPAFTYIVPEQEPVKQRFEIGEAYLDFPRGNSQIVPNFRNNRQELEKINQMIVMIASNPDITVNRVEMRGYASPESSQGFNFDLSNQRAQAMREYFAKMSTISPSLYQTGVGGEDWEGLKKYLIAYPVANRNEIMRIINTVPDLDNREELIKKVGGGAPYKKIFRDIYPKLRRVDCQINYTVRNYTLNEGKEQIRKNPKLLSQNEMYQVAQTYPKGSSEFNETLITAQRYFPGNDIANLNGAAAALSEGDTEGAREYLMKVKNKQTAEYSNCVGVLYTLEGKYADAEVFLKKAQAAGLEEATHNLRELQKKRASDPNAKRATTTSKNTKVPANTKASSTTKKR
ncbi:MAG: DUF3868 domain-containing protein [Tannerella sp.]|jgi:outer membrane protein OmpA-like peptidoglycan-associated protein|nr:DUF3868 domain-containing protein [Tannerella sp.]